MIGAPVSFRFHGELNDFLPVPRRNTTFAHSVGATDTIKHVIESLGIPHTEFERVTVNAEPRLSSDRLMNNDHVDVFPFALPIILTAHRFVVDGHLGRLGAYLRMLGFDTWYDRFADDAQLAGVAQNEQRLLLTRDVGLLKRREVEKGYCVRNHKPHHQLHEISRRFALHDYFKPFERCMDCNGHLHRVQKDEVADLLPPHTRETKNEFSRCSECKKIFWRGSHHARMLGWIQDLTSPSQLSRHP